MPLYDFLSGVLACGYAVCALFFLRFWKRTNDGFFIAFALAFALFAVGQSVLALAGLQTEQVAPVYLIRLTGFLLIIFAIARKNRATTSR
jgi:hypothetical protein